MTRQPRPRRRASTQTPPWLPVCLALWLGLALVAAMPDAALAQNTSKIEKSLASAQRDYDALELERAEKELERAIVLAERQGLADDPIAARLYIFLGVVRFALIGEGEASDAFREALTIDPDADIPLDYQTPTLSDLLQRVRDQMNGGAPSVVRPEIEHTPVEAATAGEPITFVARVPAHLPLYRVALNYRRFGEREYQGAEMLPEGRTDFSVTLRGDEVCSSQIDYFIEVLDRAGNALVATGSARSPLTTFVFGGQGECGDPIRGGGGSDEDRQFLYLHLFVGTGFGLATGTPLANPDIGLNPGLAPAPLHLVAEAGLIVTPAIQLGLMTRNQLVLLQGGVELESIIGGKLRWWFDLDDNLSMVTAVGGGHGFVRHTVDLNPELNFIDTARHGNLHAGLGFGLGYAINDNLALALDVYTMVLFPIISAHFDGSAGFRVSF